VLTKTFNISRLTWLFLLLLCHVGTLQAAWPFDAGFLDQNYPDPDYSKGYPQEQVDKGEYLVKAGDCISCHTDTTTPGAKPFAGNYPMHIKPFGTFYSPNITSDKATGIGHWDDDDFINAMQKGLRPHNDNLFPVFPYLYFNRMSRADLLAMKAYLFSIPPIHSVKKKNQVIWPFSVRFLQWGWKLLFFYPGAGEFVADPKQSAMINRGAYLVQGPGHCAMCHTPVNLFGAPKKAKYLTGAVIEDYFAPNITRGALKDYSIDDIVKVFKDNIFLGGKGTVIGPMREANHNSLSLLSDNDLRAIAAYLKTVKGPAPPPQSTAPVSPRDAKMIYTAACASCHQAGLVGAPIVGDQANWALRLKQPNGIKALVRNAIFGLNNMPPKGTCGTCSNAQIRAVVDYMVSRSVPSYTYPQALIVPTAPLPQLLQTDGQAVYQHACASCHDKGINKAPRIGDYPAWKARLAKGLDVLMHNTLKGYKNMPPKGGCTWCSNKQVIEAVKYMANQSTMDDNFKLW